MRGIFMNIRVRATLAAICSCALVALIAPAAQANLLSILPGSCGNQTESQPFSRWGIVGFVVPISLEICVSDSSGWLRSRYMIASGLSWRLAIGV